MSRLEELLRKNVEATSKLVKNAKGLGTDSEAGVVTATATPGISASQSASKEGT